MVPKVSVIVPVCDVEPYLRKCMASLQKQTLTDIEIICVDDGSTDGSRKILSEFADKDGRFRVFGQERKGAGAARNRGLEESRGEYLAFCDADDWMRPKLLEEAVNAADRASADVVVLGVRHVASPETRLYQIWRPPTHEGAFRAIELGDKAFVSFMWSVWNKLFRREAVLSAGVRFQEIPRVNDLFFAMANIAVAERIVTLRTAGYCYRHGRIGNLCSRQDEFPEAGLDAWGELKRYLESRSLYDVFAPALVRGVLTSVSNTANMLTRPEVMEAFHRRARERLRGEFGICADTLLSFGSDCDLQETCQTLTDAAGPLSHLALRRKRAQAKFVAVLCELTAVRKRLAEANVKLAEHKVRAADDARQLEALRLKVADLERRPDSVRRCLGFIWRNFLSRLRVGIVF